MPRSAESVYEAPSSSALRLEVTRCGKCLSWILYLDEEGDICCLMCGWVFYPIEPDHYVRGQSRVDHRGY